MKTQALDVTEHFVAHAKDLGVLQILVIDFVKAMAGKPVDVKLYMASAVSIFSDKILSEDLLKATCDAAANEGFFLS